MKTLVSMTLVLFCATILSAQTVPNGGFEDWSGGEPVDWTTNNVPGIPVLTQTQPGHSGSYAIRGRGIEFQRENFGPNLISGLNGFGIPVTTDYHRLSFFF